MLLPKGVFKMFFAGDVPLVEEKKETKTLSFMAHRVVLSWAARARARSSPNRQP
jgi:hypothetical protein